MEIEKKVLIIEDDESVAAVLQHNLSLEGFSVEFAADGPLGLERALKGAYSLIILDLNLPRLSGIDICKSVRQHNPAVPLIMLTSRDSEMDRVIGLESGADDYIVKPFGIYELMARVRARLRIPKASAGDNSNDSSNPTTLTCGPLSLNSDARVIKLNEHEIELTRKEFDVISYLMKNSGRVVPRSELLESVWGMKIDSYDKAIRTLMSRLQRKLQAEAPGLFFIRSIRGIGYRISQADELYQSLEEDE